MENEGLNSTPIGFLIGFFGGCIGLIICFFIGGPATKRGAIAGFSTVLFMGMCVGVAASALQIAAGAM